MIGRNAPSSDRLALRALAQRLRPESSAPPPRAAAGGFVRLGPPPASTTQPVPRLEVAPAPAPIAAPPDDLAGSGGWARLLEWCVVEVGCELAILSDDRGLVIASAGVVDIDEAQGIAARLVIAFHQADRMGAHRSPAMAIQLDTGWLTGVRVDFDGEPLTLGVMAMHPLDDAVRALVVGALDRKAQAA